MTNARRNSGFTCSGCASVAMSKSLGCDAEHQVAHRAADDEALEAGFLQPARHLARTRADLRRTDGVLVGTVDARIGRPQAGKEAGEQAADHRRR